MLKYTFPIVYNALQKHWLSLLLIFSLAVILGFIPSVKSELEAGIMDAASRPAHDVIYSHAPLVDRLLAGLMTPIERFQRVDENADVPGRLALTLLRGFHSLLSVLVLYLFVAALFYCITYLSARLNNGVKKQIFHDLRGFGLRKAFSVDSASIIPDRENPAGHLSSVIQRGAETISGTYSFVLEAGQYAFSFVVALYVIATKSWALSLVCLSVVAIQLAISVWQAKSLRKQREEFDERRNSLLSKTDEILSRREILLAYEQEGPYSRKLEQYSDAYARVERNIDNIESFYQGVKSLAEDYGRLVVLASALLVLLLFELESMQNVGDVYFLISIYIRMLVPATNLLRRFDDVRRSEALAATFLRVIKAEEEYSTHDDQSNKLWKENCSIVFRDVCFYYPGNEAILRGISLTIPANKVTLLVGPSGCGKTTIARLLLGFFRKTSGRINIGGEEIDAFSGAQLRIKMSYVSQGDHITDESVRENLAWASRERQIGDAEMLDALLSVGLGGEHKILDRISSKLSGGQQQRISIARMILDDSEIVIMDEPLAGVDVFTLNDLLPRMKATIESKAQTVLLISHRFLYTKLVDHVIIMNDMGTVSEEGSVAALKERSGIFCKLLEAARLEN